MRKLLVLVVALVISFGIAKPKNNEVTTYDDSKKLITIDNLGFDDDDLPELINLGFDDDDLPELINLGFDDDDLPELINL